MIFKRRFNTTFIVLLFSTFVASERRGEEYKVNVDDLQVRIPIYQFANFMTTLFLFILFFNKLISLFYVTFYGRLRNNEYYSLFLLNT